MRSRVGRHRRKSGQSPKLAPPKASAALDPAKIDALYGLEPVLEPGKESSGLSTFATVRCPYCAERYRTVVDLTGGSFRYVEDCQVCCQPIELCGEIGADGGLERLTPRRL